MNFDEKRLEASARAGIKYIKTWGFCKPQGMNGQLFTLDQPEVTVDTVFDMLELVKVIVGTYGKET